MNYHLQLISLLKSHILGKDIIIPTNELIRKLGAEIDKHIIYNNDESELQSLYDEAIWLKCQLQK